MKNPELLKSLEQLDIHDHLCLIYETRQEQFNTAIPFVQNGLQRGEKCLYVADDNTIDHVLKEMRKQRVDVDQALAKGGLVMLTRKESYLKDGYFDPDAMIALLKETTDRALAEGFSGLRVTGEMTWALGDAVGVDRLIEYENKLNYFFPANRALAICQYNARLFPPDIILDVILSHPKIIYGDLVCDNFYYLKPEEAASPLKPEHQIEMVKRFLSELRKKELTEEALRQSEQRLIEAQRIAGIGDFIWDVETGEATLSDALYEMLGYDKSEPIDYARVNAEIHHPEDLARVTAWLNNAIASGSSRLDPYEYRLIRKDGNEIYVRTAGRIERVKGKHVRVFATLQDITDLKQAEAHEIMERKFEAVGTLSGWLTHDMNNLLAGLFGYLELATDSLQDAPEAKKWLQKSFKIAETTRDLVKRFTAIARTTGYNKTAVLLPDLVSRNLNPPKAGDNIRVSFTCGEDIRQTEADEELLESVVRIIIENALEAMPGGGALEVAVANDSIKGKKNAMGFLLKEGDYVRVSFKDTGCGISKSNLSRIFDPYFSTKERGAQKGQGLNLPLAYVIIRQHQGHIGIESTEGRGTEVVLWLPALKETESGTVAQDKGSVSGQAPSRRVLVLDDEAYMRDMFGTMLERMGIEHSLAANGEEAMALYIQAMEEKRPFGLVFLDLTVKDGMSGVPALNILKRYDPSIRAVVMSGYSDAPVIKNYRDYGFCAALGKPFHLADFEKTVNQFTAPASQKQGENYKPK